MNAEATSKAVPKLRFPEFRDAPEWEVKSLLDVCSKIIQGGTPDTSNPTFWDGEIEWLTPSEMDKTESRFISSTARKITEKGLQKCSSDLLPINSVIISTRAPIGHLAINTARMSMNQGCKGLIPKQTTDCSFLYYLLFTSKPRLIALGAGNTFKELNGSALKEFPVNFPPYREQQKIADCLSAIDELIATQSKKVEALKEHKRGMMQQLFPAEGETQPKLRFPEFRDAPEWEVKPLAQLAHVIAGQSPRGKNYNSVGDGTPFYQGKTDFGKIFLNKPTKWTTEVTKLACQGDILMSVRAPVGALNIATEEICIGRGLASIQAKGNKWFLFYYLKQIEHSITGSGGAIFDSITKKQIDSIDICIPMTAIEQRKIADCLSSIDDLIAEQSKSIEALKEHKQGMMQQLFPAPEGRG